MIVGGIKAYYATADRLTWLLFSIVCGCILYLAVMLRQHYALGNQDRIVRLEFRLRYFRLFGKASDSVESNLSFSQIAALRFADDDEFRELLYKALVEKWDAQQIKKTIKNWQADEMRV